MKEFPDNVLYLGPERLDLKPRIFHCKACCFYHSNTKFCFLKYIYCWQPTNNCHIRYEIKNFIK